MIEFKNVSKTYDTQTHALNNVSISIDKGEFAFIVGASGAGKSTFLKLIMHEETPSRGTIIVNGIKVSNLKRRKVPYLRRNMGIVFQDFRLIEKMTVYDNVAFAMRAIGSSPAAVKKRVPYILNLVGLSHKAKRRPSELSGGEQQRVSLARALVNNPAIIIADEPTGNIDPEMSFEIIELLSKINEQGTTILVVTHEHDLVRQFNKRVIEIKKGRVVSDTNDPLLSENADEVEEVNFTVDVPTPSIDDVIAEIKEQTDETNSEGNSAEEEI
ncbi:MAG: cell division ATP-binding protein FtsE [Ruminococcus sp.]|nr:cell division ATP-binding protein FtsE [Ruminococcus sp.]